MKKQGTWIARIKHILGYKKTDDVPLDTLLENTMGYYENIIGCMPGNVYWTDKNCIAVGCNQNVLNMLGLTLSQFQGLSFEEMGKIAGWSDSTTASFKHDTLEVIQTGKQKLNIEEPPIEDIDGHTIVFLTHRVPLFDKQKNIVGAVGISIDITDRKKMETALRNEKIKSEAANHAKSEFIANMSHDIRTPLSGITGLSKLIEDEATDPTQKNYAHLLVESSGILLHLMNDVIDVISADHVTENDLHEKPFNMQHIVDDIITLEQPGTLAKGIDLIAAVDDSIPPCLISDGDKIHHILLNLVGNAIKFTKQGRIEVGVSLVNEDDATTLLAFHVKDTGIGIPMVMQDKVFDRFFRISPSFAGVYTGHGVGLHIAQSYAHLLGGNITLTSEPNVGTTFCFELRLKKGDVSQLPADSENTEQAVSAPVSHPLPSTQAPSQNPEPFIAAPLIKNAPHVLLVEDNPIAMMILKRLVTGAGFNSITAEDGQIAYDLATTQHFDWIITDLGLPHLNGIEFTTRFRAFEKQHHRQPIPIIGLTAHADDAIKKECVDAGMNAAFTKPITEHQWEKIKSTYLGSTQSNSSPLLKPIPQDRLEPLDMDAPNISDIPDIKDARFQLDDFSVLLNISSIRCYFACSDEKMEEFLLDCLNNSMPKDLSNLKHARACGYVPAVDHVVLNIRGTALYFGMEKLSQACLYLLEDKKKEGHTELFERLYEQVIQVMDETMEAFKKRMQR